MQPLSPGHLRQSPAPGSLAGDLRDLVQPLLDELSRSHGIAFVVLINPEDHGPEGVIGDVAAELYRGLARLLYQGGPLIDAMETGHPVTVDDVLSDGRIQETPRTLYAEQGLLAFVAVPLIPVSAVLVVGRDAPLPASEIDAILPYAGRLISAIADCIATRRATHTLDRHTVEKEWLWWMVNSVQDAILLTDQENRIILQNTTAERLFNARPDDSPGKRRAIEMNNVLVSAALSSFVLADDDDGPGRELTLVDPIEGNELLFEVICRPATNLRTGQQGLVLVLKDVTDLRRATDELQRGLGALTATGDQARRERDRLELVLQNVGDPIIVTDVAGQIVLMNSPAERLLAPGSSPGAHPSSAVLVANDTKLSSFLSQLRLDAGRVRRDEIELMDPDTQQVLPMSITSSEVEDELGRVTAIVSVLHDLTTLRELERHAVEQQLFESEKLAAVGRLAAAVAHEINNPMEAIKNALYLLVANVPEGDPNRRFLDIASRETERVSGIIRQMLGFYNPVSERAPTDVNQLLDDVLDLLGKQLARQRIRLHRALQARLPLVQASANQLKQVWLNLLLNAQDAMPEGGDLTVSTRLAGAQDSGSMGREYVVVEVGDTGHGIPRDHLRHLFEPFFSTKHGKSGTGLGLWVSQGIVQAHGGQIHVSSSVGHGTTFSVLLPADAPAGRSGTAEAAS